MALNPAFATHPSRKLPLAFGYVLGSGDAVFNTTAPNGSQYLTNILGEGEWDSVAMQAKFKGEHMNDGFVGQLGGIQTYTVFDDPKYFVLHTGQWTTKGLGNAATSAGVAGQNLDQWFPQYPTVTPPQALSGMAYSAYKLPGTTNFQGATWGVYGTLVGVGIWRTTRCRIFDDLGNVVSYGFTCNPAWHIVEAILRYKIKPQQPPIAGLNAAERACFNWPSIVAFAARNDFILPNGNPRFFFSGIFAADTTLANILETILRCSRAYMRVTNGQIYLIGDDQRGPVFTLSANHLVPGTLKLSKKDVSQLPNQFVARYRSIDMPAVCEVTSATYGTDIGDTLTIVSPTPSPFLANDLVTYGGAADASYDGTYMVDEPDSGYPNYTKGYVANETYITRGISKSSGSTTGGFLGTNDARFAEYAPATVNHRSHQKLIAQQAPGLSPQPKIRPVFYDMANSTFDQTNRIMKFERDSSLGPDTGASWTAPISGTLTCYFDAVDAAGNRLADVERHDVITLDDWISPEFAGQYVVKNKTVRPPSNGTLATVDLEIVTYYADAYTDVSDPPGDYYQTVPGTGFQLTGFTPVPNPAWTLIATPVGVLGSGGTWTITIPNLVMQLGGVAGTTAYPGFSVAGVPNGSPCVLFVNDPAGNGVGATFGFVAGTSLPSPAAGQYVVLIGTFTNVIPSGVTPGDPSVLFEPA